MFIFPAIDLIEGCAVRLVRGDYAQKTVYSDNPAAVAQSFAKAGAEFIKLTKAGDFEDVFKEYTDGMNALQLDFFSFQTDMAYRSAKAVFEDYENQKMLLSDAGAEDFNIEDYSEEELDSLYGSIKEKLGSAGVSEEWKNHTYMEPFFMMG